MEQVLEQMEITYSDREGVIYINKVGSMVRVDIVEDIKMVEVTLESMCSIFSWSRSGI